jgi:hypothetical protein
MDAALVGGVKALPHEKIQGGGALLLFGFMPFKTK